MTADAAQTQARHIDLHLHSTASDGANAPEVVVATAAKAGLRAIALTDHDTVEGIGPARIAAAEANIELVPGVELSAYEGEQETHILGLHIDQLEEMHDSLEVFRVARRTRAVEIVNRLNELGVRITFDDVLAVAGDAALGRPHVARAMVESGWAMDLRDAFDRYLGAGRPAYLDKRRIGIAEAIELVHRCGGIAVLAHPGPEGSQQRIGAMKEIGMDGIEVIHPSHSTEDRARLLALTTHFGLVPSGGSDSHGSPDGVRVVGSMKVPGEWLDRQFERVTSVRSSRSGSA